MRRAYIFPLLLIAFACTDRVDLNGTWTIADPGVGVSYVFTLSQAGSVITGTGHYSIAKVGGGPLLVRGTYPAPSVSLSVTSENSGSVSTFVGRVHDASHIDGSFNNWPITLVRP